jgi:hypothetical protein
MLRGMAPEEVYAAYGCLGGPPEVTVPTVVPVTTPLVWRLQLLDPGYLGQDDRMTRPLTPSFHMIGLHGRW